MSDIRTFVEPVVEAAELAAHVGNVHNEGISIGSARAIAALSTDSIGGLIHLKGQETRRAEAILAGIAGLAMATVSVLECRATWDETFPPPSRRTNPALNVLYQYMGDESESERHLLELCALARELWVEVAHV